MADIEYRIMCQDGQVATGYRLDSGDHWLSADKLLKDIAELRAVNPEDKYWIECRVVCAWRIQEETDYVCPNCNGLNGLHSGMDQCPPDPNYVKIRNGQE